MSTDPQGREVIHARGLIAESLVSARTGDPCVNVVIDRDGGALCVQVDADEARDFAAKLFAAAEAAESDAFLAEFTRETIGADDRGVVAMLREFRNFRTLRNSRKP